jgi:hypothetical protein
MPKKFPLHLRLLHLIKVQRENQFSFSSKIAVKRRFRLIEKLI